MADKEALVENFKNKTKLKIMGETMSISHFTNFNPKEPLIIANRLNFNIDPLEVPTPYYCCYRDRHGILYYFPSFLFSSLTENKVNPITGKPLPEEVITEITAKRVILQKWHKNEHLTVEISKLLDDISKDDEMNSTETDAIIAKVFDQTMTYLQVTQPDTFFSGMLITELKSRLSAMGLNLHETLPVNSQSLTSPLQNHNIFLSFRLQLAMICRVINLNNMKKWGSAQQFFTGEGI